MADSSARLTTWKNHKKNLSRRAIRRYLRIDYLEDRSLKSGFSTYPLPQSSAGPLEITSGPDGALWFTENSANAIGRITTSGAITNMAIPTIGSGPWGIASGPDGALWFTENSANKIGRLTTSGSFKEYTIPTGGSQPQGIAVGSDGALWFTEFNSNQIGRITTAGVITEFPTLKNQTAFAICAGPDGALWFTDNQNGAIGRITTQGVVTSFATSKSDTQPQGISAGPDGALWFTETKSGKIGRITTQGVVTEYATSKNDTKPYDISVGADGNLWFTEEKSVNIGQITTAGVVTEYSSGSKATEPAGICAGPDNAVWLTENNGNQIDRMAVTTVLSTLSAVSASPTSSFYGQSVTYTASVTAASGTPTGSVSFLDGTTVLGTSSLSGGSATFTTSSEIAGSHQITVKYAGDRSYLSSTSSPLAESITPAVLTITASSSSKIYGQALSALAYTYSGLTNGDSASILSGTLATTASTSSGTGAYPITQGTVAAGSNYTIHFVAGTISVSPAPLSVTASAESVVYGSSLPALSYTETGLVNGDPSSILTGSLTTTAPSHPTVGSYPITQGTLAAGLNYTISFTSGRLTVSAAPLIVSASATSKVYGAALPTFTYTSNGLVNGDTGAVFSGGLSTSATATSPVGRYSVALGTLSAGANYTIRYAGASLAITPAPLVVTAHAETEVYGAGIPSLTYAFSTGVSGLVPVFSGGLATLASNSSGVGNDAITRGTLTAGANYTIRYTPASLTVTPAPLTVTANHQNKVVNAALPTLTYTNSGFVNGDNASIISGALATTATASSPAGTYPVTQGTLDAGANYTIAFTPGTLSVIASTGSTSNTALSANAANFVYGQTVNFTAVVSGLSGTPTGSVTVLDGIQVLAIETLSGGTAIFSTTALNAGTHLIRVEYSGDTQYSSSVSSTFATLITPASLNVTAISDSEGYGEPSPVFTYSYSGLVNGDGASVFTGALACSVQPGSDVGSYPIDQGTLSAGPNYTIAYAPATLSITPAPIQVTADHESKVYGDALPTLTYSYSGLVNGDTAAVFTGAAATTANAGSNAGSYPIAEGTLSAGIDYTIAFTPGTLDVTPASLDVTADSLAMTYGSSVPSLTFTATGLVNGDTASVIVGSLTTTADSSSDVGTYPIHQGSLSAGANYTLNFLPATLSVTPALLTVTASPVSKIYGAPMPALTFTIAGLTNGDSSSVLTGRLIASAVASSDVATYPIGEGSLDPGPDYAIDFVPGALTILPAPLIVQAESSARPFGTSNPRFTAGFIGLVNGDTPSSLSGSLRFTTSATLDSAVGTYPIVPSGLSSIDYTIQFADGTLNITPRNLVASGSAVASTEGVPFSGEVATFLSPGLAPMPTDYRATIRWGDGQTSSGAISFDPTRGIYSVAGANTYREEGVYAIQTIIEFAGRVVSTTNGVAVVADAPLALLGNDFTVATPQTYDGAVASLVDVNSSSVASDFRASINWGDGSSSPATVGSRVGQEFVIFGSHSYASAGTFDVEVIVVDRGGSRADLREVAGAIAIPPSKTVPKLPVAPPLPAPLPVLKTVERLAASAGTSPIAIPLVDGPPIPTSSPPFGATGESGALVLSFGPDSREIARTALRGTLLPIAATGPVMLNGSNAPSPGNPAGAPAGTEGANGGRAGNASAAGSGGQSVFAQAASAFEAAMSQLGGGLASLGRAGASPNIRDAGESSTGLDVRTALTALALPSRFLLDELDDLERQLGSGTDDPPVARILGTGVVAYVGYVLLSTRAGYAFLSVLAAKPLWARFDPVAVLLDWEKDPKRKKKLEEEDESLESLIAGSRDQKNDEENDTHDAPEYGARESDSQPALRRPHNRSSARSRRRRDQWTKGTL